MKLASELELELKLKLHWNCIGIWGVGGSGADGRNRGE